MLVSFDDKYLEFWDHFQDLRKTLIASITAWGFFFLLMLLFCKPTVELFTQTLPKSEPHFEQLEKLRISNPNDYGIHHAFPSDPTVVFESEGIQKVTNRKFYIPPQGKLVVEVSKKPQLILLSPFEGIFTSVKVAFWSSLILSFPFWGFFLLRFLAPALHGKEINAAIPFFLMSSLALFGGVFFGYSIILPISNLTLETLNQSFGANYWTLSYFIDYSFMLLIGSTVAFELAFFFFTLIYFGIIESELLIRYRKQMIVAIFTLSAFITPPDIITQLFVAIPLWILYEIGIVFSKLKHRAKCEKKMLTLRKL